MAATLQGSLLMLSNCSVVLHLMGWESIMSSKAKDVNNLLNSYIGPSTIGVVCAPSIVA